jgi:hypothetical protein
MTMTDDILRDLGYDAAARVFEAVAPRDVGLGVFAASGERLTHAGAALDYELGAELQRAVSREGFAPGCHCVGERAALVAHRIGAGGEAAAWVVAWADGYEPDRPDWKRVVETVPRIAEMLSREYALAKELAGAVHELADRYEELNVVYRIERETRGKRDHIAALNAMLSGFVSHLHIAVGLLVTSGAVLVSRGTHRPIANIDLVLSELRGRIQRFLEASGKPLVINAVDDDRRAYLLTNLPFKLLAIPSGGCRETDGGLLLLRHLDEPDFTNSDQSLARVFCGQASFMSWNQSLVSRMQNFTRQIASSLVEAVEAKDPYTRGHSERVETIVRGLLDSVGFPEEQRSDLLWGALLHDIGKIGIPDAILMKPTRLNEDEYTFIKTHPNRSFEILRHIGELGPAALDAARFHQERFDGSGYPFGLAREEIPLAARITSVADTYDAVTSSRSYRPAGSHDEGVAIVRAAAGSQLDPVIVAAFCRLAEQNERWLYAIRPQRDVPGDG